MSENYNIEDFTLSHYRDLLLSAKKNWTFRFFTNYGVDERFVLWRHDVDFSLHQALELAKIENEIGVQSTYFILPHSDFYSILEQELTDIITEIQNLGHQIGLHFDSHYYGVTNEAELVGALEKEKRFFRDIFNINLQAFSFHNTTDFTMNCKEMHYADLVNVYAAYFQENVRYCSDSNGYWRFDRLFDVLQDSSVNRLQILTHPVWWQEKPMLPFERIRITAELRCKNSIENYENTLKKFKRVNVK